MTDPIRAPEPHELHAWVDGELSAARAAEVADWVAHDAQAGAEVAAWQAQRAALRSAHAGLLHAAPPASMRAALRAPPWWRDARVAWAAAAAALVAGVGLGAVLGPARDGARGVPGSALRAEAPAFVRDAAAAHAVYVPEQRHPVEVGASEQAHLLQWLSRRLATPLKAPSFDDLGYALVGGRLLPGPQGQARAQFMYQRAAATGTPSTIGVAAGPALPDSRLTLYVSVLADDAPAAPPSFSWQPDGEGAAASFYWIEGRQGYALSGALPRPELARLADAAYRQLMPTPPPTR